MKYGGTSFKRLLCNFYSNESWNAAHPFCNNVTKSLMKYNKNVLEEIVHSLRCYFVPPPACCNHVTKKLTLAFMEP